MTKKLTSRLLSVLVSLCMVLALVPTTAFAAEGDVARIGDQTYATLDKALDAAAASEEDTVTITVLQSCTIEKSITIPKDKTFTLTAATGADITITDSGRYGMRPNGSLTMENITFVTNGQIALNGTTADGPFGREVIFRNSTLQMDGGMYQFNGDGYYCAAIFADSPALLRFDHCNVDIKNYPSTGSAIRWNGKNGDDGYGVEIINGTVFNSSNCYSGFVGTLDLLVDSSTLNVMNHRGNGSNGSNYTITNSKVTYSGNGSHGISAGNLVISRGSTVTSTDNGMYGVYVNGDFLVDSTSTLNVTGNSSNGDYAGLKLTGGVTNGKVEAGAVVNITGNYCSGLSNNGKVVFEEGSNLTITGNYNDKGTTSNGGGVYNTGSSANLTLPSDAVIYNNHAVTAGDDIYNTGTITFGPVGSDWSLDGQHGDCEHKIDGWYDDSADTRWKAHAETEDGNHIDLFNSFDEGTGLATVTTATALKAAHGTDAQDKTSYPGMNKQVQDGKSEGQPVWSDSTTAAAGDTVNFQLTTNVPDDLRNYIIPDVDAPKVQANAIVPVEDRGEYPLTIHDQMDDELLLNDDSIVVMLGDDILIQPDQYTIAYNVAHDDEICDFEITLDLINLYESGAITEEDITRATPITVTYSATLSEEAEAGDYLNTAWVAYPEGESGESTVTVYTYSINIFKYDQSTVSEESGEWTAEGLSGAVFALYAESSVTVADDGTVTVNEGAESVWTGTSGADGYVTINGLDEGIYYLVETEAPENYVKSDKPLKVVISDDADEETNIANVNFANSPVPHTGGTGTVMYTVGGVAIIVLAGILLVVYRKSRKKQDR